MDCIQKFLCSGFKDKINNVIDAVDDIKDNIDDVIE